MLGALGPSAPKPATVPPAAATPAELSEDEELVLRQAKEESRRLTQMALERMFDKSARPAEPTAGFEALLAQEAEPQPAEASRSKGAFARAADAVLDFVNAPFRWLPHSFRLGLGLCGVLLLITLLVVMIVRALRY